MHLVSANGKKVLLDCGLFQGKRAESSERNRVLPFDASLIDAVVLSHAHIDHAGNLPNLVRSGFAGPIIATSATRDLSNVMLHDSAHIHERDAEFVSKKNKRRGEPGVEPMYTGADVDQTIEQMKGFQYGEPIEVVEGITVEFFDAGHILGSAVMRLTVEERGKKTVLGFTGDLGRKNMPILRDPESMGDVEYLISESTYGGKIHDPIQGMKGSLTEVLERTIHRGGKIIVPAFSVGKTQDFLHVLFHVKESGRFPDLPIYVDSPLAVDATDVFRSHPECFDDETLAILMGSEDPFGFRRLRYIRDVNESKRLNDVKEPCVIISASGMCEAGRILHHLANNIEDERNTILIIGYMAEHTLGRRLVERQPEVRIFGDVFPRKAEVVVLNSFSAHAGQDELVNYIGALDRRLLKRLFLVHGELQQAQALQKKLEEQGIHPVHIPARGERTELI